MSEPGCSSGAKRRRPCRYSSAGSCYSKQSHLHRNSSFWGGGQPGPRLVGVPEGRHVGKRSPSNGGGSLGLQRFVSAPQKTSGKCRSVLRCRRSMGTARQTRSRVFGRAARRAAIMLYGGAILLVEPPLGSLELFHSPQGTQATRRAPSLCSTKVAHCTGGRASAANTVSSPSRCANHIYCPRPQDSIAPSRTVNTFVAYRRRCPPRDTFEFYCQYMLHPCYKGPSLYNSLGCVMIHFCFIL